MLTNKTELEKMFIIKTYVSKRTDCKYFFHQAKFLLKKSLVLHKIVFYRKIIDTLKMKFSAYELFGVGGVSFCFVFLL